MILLDTCALIWSIFETEKLSSAARNAILNNPCTISIVSLWEIAIKTGLGKLELSKSISEIADLCADRGVEILPITPEACEVLQHLPPIHKDPFDRMIIAQAMTRGLPLLTEDSNIQRYETLETIW